MAYNTFTVTTTQKDADDNVMPFHQINAKYELSERF